MSWSDDVAIELFVEPAFRRALAVRADARLKAGGTVQKLSLFLPVGKLLI